MPQTNILQALSPEKTFKEKDKMKIGIIGRGVVGNAVANGLSKAYEIISYDKYRQGFETLKEVSECKIIFICVPTPSSDKGIDLIAIYDVIDMLTIYIKDMENKIFIIKSTVTPGTTEKLSLSYGGNWVFCPEFLCDRSADSDFVNADRIILGTHSVDVYAVLYEIFRKADFTCAIYKTTPTIAEFIKYYSNILGATKITLANEMYNIAKKLGIDYKEIKKLLVTNHYFSDYHLDVPGPDEQFGWGGKCFKKDLAAFIYFAKTLGYKPWFLEELEASNKKFRGEK